jgi:DAK2 domain fusion protein YloV
LVWDGPRLASAFALSASWLDHHHEQVNALNVFPVPDGDTGTNMAMTMRSALAATSGDGSSAGVVAGQIAHGALMGARGNSGVILSQIFRGFAAPIRDRDEIDGRDLALALGEARDMAYRAVMRPVEGTMLTVIRGAAERASKAAERSPSLVTVLHAAVMGARDALASTPGLLDILRQANVVDAGGQGVVYILEGLERFAGGETFAPDELSDTATATGASMAFLDQIGELHGEDPFGYCTNFMVFGKDLDFEKSRNHIAAMGQSAVIVGDDSILKVHIHTENPGRVLDYAIGLGDLDQIKIDNMSKQTDALTAQRSDAVSSSPAPVLPRLALEERQPNLGSQAIVTCAAGDGLADALRAMGATTVVRGGQTTNPSTADLLDAVEAEDVDQVILLPNNKNIILTANQIAELTPKQVRVVPSTSVPQGLAALAVFNDGHNLDQNVENMSDALKTVQTVELTMAVRDVELNGVQVAKGQTIGLIDDQLFVSGDSIPAVARDVLARIPRTDAELISIFPGEDACEEDVRAVSDVVSETFTSAEVEVHEGGQPHYLFIIAIE